MAMALKLRQLQSRSSETKLNLSNTDEVGKEEPTLIGTEVLKIIKGEESESVEKKNAKREAEVAQILYS